MCFYSYWWVFVLLFLIVIEISWIGLGVFVGFWIVMGYFFVWERGVVFWFGVWFDVILSVGREIGRSIGVCVGVSGFIFWWFWINWFFYIGCYKRGYRKYI